MVDLQFFLGVFVGIQGLFILLLYERIARLSKKVGELQGIRKGEYFGSKKYEGSVLKSK